MGENRKRSKVESESESESPERRDKPQLDEDFKNDEEDFFDSENSFGDGDEAFDSLQDTDSSISDAYTARFPFILKDVYLEARIDPQTRHQTISILKINPESGAIEQKDSHECIHTVVTVLSTDEFADIQSDPDKKEAFLRQTVNLRARDRTARERGEVFEDRGEEEGELFLNIDDQFFAFRSWVQGIAEADMDVFKVGDEFATASQLQEPIGGMLFRFLMQQDFDFFLQYFDKIVRECRFEGALHKPSLWANLDVLIENIDPKTSYNYDIAAHEKNLNMFVQMLCDLDVDYVFNFLHRIDWKGGRYLIPIIVKNLLERPELTNRTDFKNFYITNQKNVNNINEMNIQIKRALAVNELSAKIPEFRNLFFDRNSSVRVCVASNPSATSFKEYRDLFFDPVSAVRANVASNPRAVEFKEFESLFLDKDKDVRSCIPYNPNCFQFPQFHQLFLDSEPSVRQSVARREESTLLLEYINLFHDSDRIVREICAENLKATEIDEYNFLFLDEKLSVLNAIAKNPKATRFKEYRIFFLSHESLILMSVAENPNAPVWDEYRLLFDCKNPYVRLNVARNLNATRFIEYQNLLTDQDNSVRQAAAYTMHNGFHEGFTL